MSTHNTFSKSVHLFFVRLYGLNRLFWSPAMWNRRLWEEFLPSKAKLLSVIDCYSFSSSKISLFTVNTPLLCKFPIGLTKPMEMLEKAFSTESKLATLPTFQSFKALLKIRSQPWELHTWETVTFCHRLKMYIPGKRFNNLSSPMHCSFQKLVNYLQPWRSSWYWKEATIFWWFSTQKGQKFQQLPWWSSDSEAHTLVRRIFSIESYLHCKISVIISVID